MDAATRVVPEVGALPPELLDRVRGELDSGERLIWTGQPRPGLSARAALPLALFGIPFFSFAVFWTGMALSMTRKAGGAGAPPFFSYVFPLFGLPFLAVGLAMLLSPLGCVRSARRTAYALTDRRAIVFAATAFGGREVRSYSGGELGGMMRRERRDGSGDLVLEEAVSLVTTKRGQRLRTRPRGFMAIPNVREVEKLVRATLGVDRE